MAAAGLLAPLRPLLAVQSEGAIDVVERFGFVPDGRTDNYAAFHRLADHANRARGGNYRFPPGDYYVARIRIRDQMARDPREVISAQFRNCDGLAIAGHGARISLNGRFHRTRRVGNASVFMPFEIRHSRNVRIAGFDIDGGVRDMRRDPDVPEAYSYLVAIHACRDVVLEDLFLHHGQTDGLLLSDDVSLSGAARGTATRNVLINRVRCHNNARGGLAPLHVLGLRCTDSSFNGNGFDLGAYLAHAPGFGVDVEPDRYRPHEIDTRTGNLHFERCEFNDNIGNFLAGFTHTYQGYLRLVDCSSTNRHNQSNAMLVAWPGALVQGGSYDVGTGWFWTSWEGERGGDLTLRGCEIRGAGNYSVHHAHDGNIVHLDGVRMIGTHRSREPGPFIALYADPGGGRRNTMRNCEIFVPAARKSLTHAYDPRVALANLESENNLFRTDLPAAGGRHFATEYRARVRASGDRYRGTSPGPADSFRPGINSEFDTRRPFSATIA